LGGLYRVALIETEKISSSSLVNLRADVAEGTDYVELVSSIRRHGVIQPIIVRSAKNSSSSKDAKFEIVCGHRRHAACRSLNKKLIPSIVMKLDNQQAIEIALVENLQRRSLDPVEEAEGFKMYISAFGRGSVSRLAEKIGKSEEYVSHRLLLLGLPKTILRRISRRLLKPSEATELIWLKDEKTQLELADQLIKNNMSFRKARAVVRILRAEKVSVGAAVERVLRSKVDRIRYPVKDPNSADMQGRILNSSAVNRSDEDDRDLAQSEILTRTVLVLRTCLSGIDLIMERNSLEDLRELLMNQRQTIHASLDAVIRQTVKLKARSRNQVILAAAG
jgi:ParB/RepB/Spo0J family partition protein